MTHIDDATLARLAYLASQNEYGFASLEVGLALAELRRLRTDNFYLDQGQEKLADEVRRLRTDLAFAQSDLAVARVTIEAQAGADMERVRLRAEVEALREDRDFIVTMCGDACANARTIAARTAERCNCGTWDDALPGGAQGANPPLCPVHGEK